jgi:hypothetical protein
MTQPSDPSPTTPETSPVENPGHVPTDPDTEGNPVTPPNPAENPAAL